MDPYGFHLCSAMNNRVHLHLVANYELRLIHQYDTRRIRYLLMSKGGHLIAVVLNNFIQIYSTIYFNLICQLRGHIGKIQQVIWCRHDSMLISCGTDGMIYAFNTFTGNLKLRLNTKKFDNNLLSDEHLDLFNRHT
jgi:WD40 repeat protein